MKSMKQMRRDGDLCIGGRLTENEATIRLQQLMKRGNTSPETDEEIEELTSKLGIIPKADFEIFRFEGNTDLEGEYKVIMIPDRTWCSFDWLNTYKRKQLYMDVKKYQKFKKGLMVKYPGNRFLSGMSLTSNGRILFKSDSKVDHADVSQIFERLNLYKRSIHVNTGTHGDPLGQTIFTNPELIGNQQYLIESQSFLQEDIQDLIKNYDKLKISITLVHSQQWPHYPTHVDTIDAWCFSSLTPMVPKDKQSPQHIQKPQKTQPRRISKPAQKPQKPQPRRISKPSKKFKQRTYEELKKIEKDAVNNCQFTNANDCQIKLLSGKSINGIYLNLQKADAKTLQSFLQLFQQNDIGNNLVFLALDFWRNNQGSCRLPLSQLIRKVAMFPQLSALKLDFYDSSIPNDNITEDLVKMIQQKSKQLQQLKLFLHKSSLLQGQRCNTIINVLYKCSNLELLKLELHNYKQLKSKQLSEVVGNLVKLRELYLGLNYTNLADKDLESIYKAIKGLKHLKKLGIYYCYNPNVTKAEEYKTRFSSLHEILPELTKSEITIEY